jgi:hypothetical protein
MTESGLKMTEIGFKNGKNSFWKFFSSFFIYPQFFQFLLKTYFYDISHIKKHKKTPIKHIKLSKMPKNTSKCLKIRQKSSKIRQKCQKTPQNA